MTGLSPLLCRRGRLLLPYARPHPQRNPRVAAKGVRTEVRMAGGGGRSSDEVGAKGSPIPNRERYLQFQEFIQKNPLDGWDSCWKNGLTPWDQGKPTPVVEHLLQTNALPKGRVLVPGCGTGYDVVAIAGPERYVVGLDISETAVKKSQEFFSSLPNAKYFTFLAEDFFKWRPDETFDLIFDYTFFCAIDPCMRSSWAEAIHNMLKPDGELITLMFPIGDDDGGPPYALHPSNYENVLSPFGFEVTSMVDNELAIDPRKGREKLGRWKRRTSQSLM